MKYLAAVTALGLLASTAAYAQNAQPQSNESQTPAQAQSTEPATAGSQALSKSFVRQIQMRLRAQGMYDGKVTGTWDDQTAKAVQEFQQERNIQATGEIDGPTIIALLHPGMGMGMGGEGSSWMRGGMMGGGMGMPMVRSYERGYQQGFEQGLRWAREQHQ
jgi:peptidoglycan hydrolase-like protein with peptidoglycan-binding domain